MIDNARRLKDLMTVQPNYSDMKCPINKRDVNNSAPEIKFPKKHPETARTWTLAGGDSWKDLDKD